MTGEAATWSIAGLATAGVIIRPARLPEAIWAVAGAAALIALGLMPLNLALDGVLAGADVTLFLTGMMLLAETARREGLFDWLASAATAFAKGSPKKLFALVYGVGIVVTTFLSNDATAVVLTPAVLAAASAAKVRDPLPYALTCAFVANAASFVLPISNPANLVVFGGGHMPALWQWIGRFALASVASVAATFVVLYATQRRALGSDSVATDVGVGPLSTGGIVAAFGVAATAAALIAASALGFDLGAPTAAAGLVTAAAALLCSRKNPLGLIRDVSWGVLPLVAGLFVLVEALNHTGVTAMLSAALRASAAASPAGAAWGWGVVVAFACNLMNNLPVGLVAGATVQGAQAPADVASALLIGVDLGPNLSVTGSLATILWLTALRRENLSIGGWRFLTLGALVMPPALVAALAAVLLLPFHP